MLQKWEISAGLMGHKAHMKNYWQRLVFRSQSDLVEGNLYLNDFLIPRLFFTQRAIPWVPPHYLVIIFFTSYHRGRDVCKCSLSWACCITWVSLSTISLFLSYSLLQNRLHPAVPTSSSVHCVFNPEVRFFYSGREFRRTIFFFWGMWSIGLLTPKKNCSQELIIVSPGAGGWGWFLPKQKIDAITSQRL